MSMTIDLRRCTFGMLLLLMLSALSRDSLAADVLRYSAVPGQKFEYEMAISVEEEEKTISYQGVVNYTVESADAEQLRLTYRGGLPETTKLKPRTRSSSGPFGPFGAPGLPMRPMGGPFQRSPFPGRVHTTNSITMTPQGDVLAIDGDSQLPYLLGNVSLLPFESLPKEAQREWVVDAGVSITEEPEDRRSFGMLGPRMGLEPQNKTVQVATEVIRYSIESQTEQIVRIKKSYQLTSPASAADSFSLTGAGYWVFDRKEKLPLSLDMSAKLIVKEGNASNTYPISIKYTRLSPEETMRRAEEARKQQEATARKMAEEKARAEAPLTKEQKLRALSLLQSTESQDLTSILTELEKKSPLESDADIVRAIQPHISSSDKAIAELARKALSKWSPEFKRKHALQKAYEGPSPVDSTEKYVESTTRLQVGQIVQVQENGGFWFPARISRLLPDNKVQVQYMQWGKPGRDATVGRRNIQLAPDELEQPDLVMETQPAIDPNHKPVMRTWTDNTGKYKIEAAFSKMTSSHVSLVRADGKTVEIAIDKLSPADQAFARQLHEDAENPFKVK